MWHLIPLLGTLLDKLLPDPAAAAAAKLEILKLAQSGELAQLEAVKALNLAQIEVNQNDASSPRAFQANARPSILWVCAMALAWDTVVRPMATMAWVMAGHAAPVLPTLSTDQLYGLLTGLLGLSGYRTFEKVKGVAQ